MALGHIDQPYIGVQVFLPHLVPIRVHGLLKVSDRSLQVSF